MSVVELSFTPPDQSVIDRWLTPVTDPDWNRDLKISIDNFHLRGFIGGHYLVIIYLPGGASFGLKREYFSHDFEMVKGTFEFTAETPRRLLRYQHVMPFLPDHVLDALNDRCSIFDWIRRSSRVTELLPQCDFGEPIGNDFVIPWPEHQDVAGRDRRSYVSCRLTPDRLAPEHLEWFRSTLPDDLSDDWNIVEAQLMALRGTEKGAVFVPSLCTVTIEHTDKSRYAYEWVPEDHVSDVDVLGELGIRDKIDEVYAAYRDLPEDRAVNYERTFYYQQLYATMAGEQDNPAVHTPGSALQKLTIFDIISMVKTVRVIEQYFPLPPSASEEQLNQGRATDQIIELVRVSRPWFTNLAKENPYIRHKIGELSEEMGYLRDAISRNRDLLKDELDRRSSSSA